MMRSRTRVAVAATIASGLGSLALLPTYSDMKWLPVTWGAILVVGVVAQGSRLAGVPPLLSPVLALAGLAAYVTAVFSRGTAYLGFLPGSSARSVLNHLTDSGWHDISVLRAPVPSNQGLILLTVCGVGLVAIVVDLIAVVGRRPALAGLPLLALFAVSASTVSHGVGWLPFVYAGAGYVALLLTESADRISRWGHPLGMAHSTGAGDEPATVVARAQTTPLIQVGRRVGVAAIAVAVVVPFLIPGLHGGLFGTTGHGTGLGSGNSTVTTYNPILKIKDQLQRKDQLTLLKYKSNAETPGYLRMTALDRFDGSGWTQGDLQAHNSQRISKGLPTPPGLSSLIARRSVSSSVQATSSLLVHWLPTPYPTVSLKVNKGDWRWDGPSGAIFSTEATTKSRSWSSTSLQLQPTPAQLKAATTDHPPDLDADVNADTRVIPGLLTTTAHSVTKNASTPFEKAVALQDYFHTSKFHYNINAPSTDSAAVLQKFLEDGQGYCVQFATAMALMARSVGIPSRVAIGFTRGTQQSDGSYQITTFDAHAWPELYFNTIGWLAFEPTPRGDGQAVSPSYATDRSTGPAPGTSTSPDDPSAQATPTPSTSPLAANPGRKLDDRTPAPITSSKSHNHWGAILLGLLIALVVGCAPALGRWLTRRRRWSGAETAAARAHVAWRELGDDARDLGFPWRPADSPRRAVGRLLALTDLAEPSEDLLRLARAEERARYARDLPELGDLASDERAVRRELARVAGRSRRLAAIAMPRSTVSATTSFIANRIADVLDFVDAAVSFGYRLVTPRRLRRN
jgi:transglutaminase-like putative cysteine protease